MLAWPKGNYEPVEQRVAGAIIGAATVATTLLVSPLVGAAGFFLAVGASTYLFRKSDFNREVKRLQKKGYVALTKTADGWIVKVLKKGRRRYKEIEMSKLKLPRPVKWDGKWRMFIFDIPEEMRSRRDSLRDKLKSLGLYNIQRSVFVYPFDCRKEMAFVAGYFNLDKYTTYAEVCFSDIDRELKRHFKSLKVIS